MVWEGLKKNDSQLTKCKFELYAIQAIRKKNNDHFPLHLQQLNNEQHVNRQLWTQLWPQIQ